MSHRDNERLDKAIRIINQLKKTIRAQGEEIRELKRQNDHGKEPRAYYNSAPVVYDWEDVE